MFNLHDFVMNTLSEMRGRETEYKIRQYALAWYDKGILTDTDMANLSTISPAEESTRLDEIEAALMELASLVGGVE